MSATERRKGATYEREVERYLAARWNTDRTAVGISVDDIAVHELALSIEAKNHRALNLAGWVAQAVEQAAARGDGWLGCVLHKKRGTTDVGDHYVTMRAADFVDLVERLRSR